MTDKEKANELAQQCDFTTNSKEVDIAFKAALKMAEWKDEGFLEWLKKINTYTAKDKSKYIRFAIEFLEEKRNNK